MPTMGLALGKDETTGDGTGESDGRGEGEHISSVSGIMQRGIVSRHAGRGRQVGAGGVGKGGGERRGGGVGEVGTGLGEEGAGNGQLRAQAASACLAIASTLIQPLFAILPSAAG